MIYDVCTKALAELQTQAGVPDAKGENWAAACKKLGVNPLHVNGQWQEGLSSSGAGGVSESSVFGPASGSIVFKMALIGPSFLSS